jgi:hypothetical protein
MIFATNAGVNATGISVRTKIFSFQRRKYFERAPAIEIFPRGIAKIAWISPPSLRYGVAIFTLSFVRSENWARQGSNLHGLLHRILSPACLPIPPRARHEEDSCKGVVRATPGVNCGKRRRAINTAPASAVSGSPPRNPSRSSGRCAIPVPVAAAVRRARRCP